MTGVFAVLVVLAGVALTAEGCCTPDQWEGFVGEVVGVARKRSFRPPSITALGMQLSYDATNSKIESTAYVRDKQIKHIVDFPDKKLYVVMDDRCKEFNFTRPFKKFCTEGANKTGSMYYGVGDGALQADNYFGTTRNFVASATVTQDGCVPIGEVGWGKMRRDYVIFTVGYVNITSGIADPSIFNPPSSCKPATQTLEAYFEELDHLPSQFILEKLSEFPEDSSSSEETDEYLRFEAKQPENNVV